MSSPLETGKRQTSWRTVAGALILYMCSCFWATPGAVAGGAGDARKSARIFLSGHSLTDNPFADDIVAIAASLGASARYNQQIIVGSPIRVRTRGMASAGWAGYKQGKNREGENLDVISELREPRSFGKDLYDTLIITERNDLMGPLVWEDTVRHLRHYHDRLIEGNGRGRTFFFESWLNVRDRSKPADWIAYERSASPIWQCMAARVNASLTARGRADRIESMPAGAALAHLVETALASPGLDGITGTNADETLGRLFADDVHLTRLGIYYMALVAYAEVFQSSPKGAWAPRGIERSQAGTLQDQAWNFVSKRKKSEKPPALSECRALMSDSFCKAHFSYMNRPDQVEGCRQRFSKEEEGNPFYYSTVSDNAYWFPAP